MGLEQGETENSNFRLKACNLPQFPRAAGEQDKDIGASAAQSSAPPPAHRDGNQFTPCLPLLPALPGTE